MTGGPKGAGTFARDWADASGSVSREWLVREDWQGGLGPLGGLGASPIFVGFGNLGLTHF